jgi:hypothetical protein
VLEEDKIKAILGLVLIKGLSKDGQSTMAVKLQIRVW